MIIELWRKLVATEPSVCYCVICCNDFNRGSVSAVVFHDNKSEDIGDVCPTCLEYLNRRKQDAQDPALGNWPARGWPTSQDLEEACRRYLEPMFASYDDLLAAAVDRDADDEIYEASVVWRMEPKSVPA